jgi:uncharacterized Ntn-hydrolase superfamily protein
MPAGKIDHLRSIKLTFSIVARDESTGQIGVAVQTHWFAVGAMCPWIEAGVAAVATQSLVEVSYGPKSLDLLREGSDADEALQKLLAADENREVRQVAIIDCLGHVAVHTGERCIREAGHVKGVNFSVQANMMKHPTVWTAMARAFESAKGSLAERMLAALFAAQAEGGDIRGKQSAAMLVAEVEKTDEPWKHQLVNIRVDDHPEPLKELERLLNIQKAYDLMNEGDELLGKSRNEEAKGKYSQAAELAPDLMELPFWQAVTLADTGKLDQALPLFQKIFSQNPDWAELVMRLPAAGLMKDDPQVLEKIRSLI